MILNTERLYLIENRLADVLALIQVLAMHEFAHRAEADLVIELQGSPRSGVATWRELASEHPEFFRLRSDAHNAIALVARHVQPRNDSNGRDVLTPEFTQYLLTTAIQLHEQQIKRDQRRAFLVPIWAAVTGAFVAGFFAIFVAIVNACSGSH
jgi:hypothetical protein